MRRRSLIRTSTVLLLAGCTETSEANQSPTRSPTSTPFPETTPPAIAISPSEPPINNRGEISDNEAISSLKEAARDNGMNIFYQEFGERRWVYFEYSSDPSAEDTVMQNIEVFVNEYIELTKEGWSTYLLEASLKDPAKDYPNALIASWYCKRDWVEAAIDGGVSKDELLSRVSETIVKH